MLLLFNVSRSIAQYLIQNHAHAKITQKIDMIFHMWRPGIGPRLLEVFITTLPVPWTILMLVSKLHIKIIYIIYIQQTRNKIWSPLIYRSSNLIFHNFYIKISFKSLICA